MSNFADVEDFGRLHADCGGIKPAATPQPSGGYLLTLTCACGATLDRRVSLEDARKPLPLPRRAVAPAPARRPPPRPAPPSSELQAALAAALEAEAVPEAPPAAPPPPSPPTGPKGGDIEAVMREALASETTAAAPRPASPRPSSTPAPPGRTSPGKLNLDSTIRTALTQQSDLAAAAATRPAPPRTRLAVLIVLMLVVFGATGALYFALRGETSAPEEGAPPPAPTLDEQQRAALNEMLASLRQLQSASTPGTSLSVYSSRVIFAKSDVARFMGSTAPGPLRAGAREVLDIHLLAAAAWRARSENQREALEAVGQDPAIDLCPTLKRVVDFSAPPSDSERARARGVVVASSIPLLWECAAQKLAALDRLPGH